MLKLAIKIDKQKKNGNSYKSYMKISKIDLNIILY